MTTRLELGRSRIFHERHQKRMQLTGQRSEVAQFADEDGIYATPYGKIGVTFTKTAENGNTVILDVTDVKALQGKKGKTERRIFAGGSQQISDEYVLFVRTDKQFT